MRGGDDEAVTYEHAFPAEGWKLPARRNDEPAGGSHFHDRGTD